ncbi:MAG: hypothetical protein COT90_02730 [Candidatus Diapherotrites archaeon CG10_big_fil_rev_8_21_14_0_10_31_34]|nr:MAG: hypothetical protein COT90_02730 [Candidatus Diapherotrites archaeon CG10_big_fil_rev_8_21_14_0_10_31_34]
MQANELAMYGLIFFGIILSGMALMNLNQVQHKTVISTDEKGVVLKTEENQKIFEEQAIELDSKCGDLEDKENIQHLSHHPGMYMECLEQVDSEKLMEATGKTLEEILGQNFN